MEKVKTSVVIEGPIYDMTDLPSEGNQQVDWLRIFTLRNPGEWTAIWVYDLAREKDKGGRKLLVKWSEFWKLFPYDTILKFRVSNGLIEPMMGWQRLADESKVGLQNQWPGKIIVAKFEEPNPGEDNSMVKFGPTTLEELGVIKAIPLTAEDYTWEKRVKLEKERDEANAKSAVAEAQLKVL